ncbi:hypothetical protein BKA69DRAFT_1012934, partial [Paraphysoderma sedebokerense]
KYTARRVPKLSSDPVSTNCCCPKSSGFVILFYKYTRISEPFVSAQKLESLCLRLKLTGKIRVAVEGLNVTLAGDKRHVNTFVREILDWDCFSEESFDLNAKQDVNMDIFNDKQIRDFFKPTPGCTHAFPNLSVRVVEEICPLGAPELQPMKLKSRNTLQSSTSETPYHPLMQQLNLTSDEVLLIDTRNYYESQLGKFVNAVTPNIRKFGSWKTWVDEYLIPNKKPKKVKAILSYCTGGIRCEKATEYVREKLRESIDVAPIPVYQLAGGIDRYLAWVADELKNKSQMTEKPSSLFLGKNYVFDSRVSTPLKATTVISRCKFCDTKSTNYLKCSAVGCHLLFICCEQCASGS